MQRGNPGIKFDFAKLNFYLVLFSLILTPINVNYDRVNARETNRLKKT